MPARTPPVHPFHPIIYLRGYAATQGAIEDTVATPYMGFNLGSTKVRQEWDRSVSKHVFESPLVRLMKDYGYRDTYQDGQSMDGPIPAKSILVYRYYDVASGQLGDDRTPGIPEAAAGLSELILKTREQVCGGDAAARAVFRVYLVAHSMGGLICRCLLQNDGVGSAEAKALVDKVFTYGTPHNGIELRGLNVPGWFGVFDADNFNRSQMRKYLALPADCMRVDSLNGKFDPARFFCLVGTNHRDYSVARFPVGPMSDGLVKIENAVVAGAPRAFVYRSHSGHFGLVNSEEGYQNLVRFLFGDTFVNGTLQIDTLPLPPAIHKAHENGQQIRASYLFEATVTPRGAFSINLTERRADEASAIFRSYDELMHPQRVQLQSQRAPVLFSVFLDSKKIEKGSTLVFTIRLAVRTTDYEILGSRKRHAAELLFEEAVTIRATIGAGGWRLRYVLSDQWSESLGRDMLLDADSGLGMVPLQNKKGFAGRLQLDFSHWNLV